MYSRSSFTRSSGNQRVNRSQTLQKSERGPSYPLSPSFWHRSSLGKYLLLKYDILGLFINPLTGDAKYSRHNTRDLPQLIQNKFILKSREFFWVFHCIFRIYIKFWTFFKRLQSQSLSISEIIYSKKRGYLNA